MSCFKHPPPLLYSWLTHRASLTEKLQSIAGDARLELLHQSWEEADAFDKRKLHIEEHQILHRNIIMWAFETRCWFARSIIPFSTYQNHASLFDRLQQEPLGMLLFNPMYQITRHTFEYYEVTKNSEEYTWLDLDSTEESLSLWVRLSEFKIKMNDSFYLVEILLPGLMRFCS